jgi:hypothetical protein
MPDEVGEAVVRRDWQSLQDAGLPSMADHTGATNTPHVTILALPGIGDELERRAVDLVATLLPLVVRPSGIALLGGEKVTVARLLDVPLALTRAVLDLRDNLPDGAGERHPGWLPHLTLGRRLPRSDTARAIDLVGYADHALTLVGLRRWDPEQGTVRILSP